MKYFLIQNLCHISGERIEGENLTGPATEIIEYLATMSMPGTTVIAREDSTKSKNSGSVDERSVLKTGILL